MNVKQLHAELSKMIDDGLGKHPVRIQEVVNGFTYGLDFGISEGNPFDGKVVWLWVKENENRSRSRKLYPETP